MSRLLVLQQQLLLLHLHLRCSLLGDCYLRRLLCLLWALLLVLLVLWEVRLRRLLLLLLLLLYLNCFNRFEA